MVNRYYIFYYIFRQVGGGSTFILNDSTYSATYKVAPHLKTY